MGPAPAPVAATGPRARRRACAPRRAERGSRQVSSGSPQESRRTSRGTQRPAHGPRPAADPPVSHPPGIRSPAPGARARRPGPDARQRTARSPSAGLRNACPLRALTGTSPRRSTPTASSSRRGPPASRPTPRWHTCRPAGRPRAGRGRPGEASASATSGTPPSRRANVATRRGSAGTTPAVPACADHSSSDIHRARAALPASRTSGSFSIQVCTATHGRPPDGGTRALIAAPRRA